MLQSFPFIRWPVIALLLAILALTACGKKGALYLPERPPAADTDPKKPQN